MSKQFPYPVSHPSHYPRLRDIPEEYREPFKEWLSGQTVPILEGEAIEDQDAFYPWDFMTWIEKARVGLPYAWD
jgi:hypothetical protein